MYKKLIITIPIILVLFGLLYFARKNDKRSFDKLSIVLVKPVYSQEEKIEAWYNEEEAIYYYFVPMASSNDLLFRIENGFNIFIDDEIVMDGALVSPFISDSHIYKLECYAGKNREVISVKFIQSQNTSAVFLHTATNSMKQIYNEKEHKEPVCLRVLNDGNEDDNVEKEAIIKGRGNSSWTRSKKSFSIIFEEEVSILELSESSRWALISNSYDDYSVRNEIAFELGRRVGIESTPESRFVEVYLNGEYNGLYQLVQAPSSIYKLLGKEEDDLVICSSDIVSRYREKPKSFFDSSQEHLIEVVSETDESEEIRLIAEEKFSSVDEVIKSNDSAFLEDTIDINSWASKYIVDELLGNYDSGVASMMFYWDKHEANSKVYAGPLWDYDNCLNNNIYGFNKGTENPRVVYAMGDHRDAGSSRLWYPELYCNERFYETVLDVYNKRIRVWVENEFDDYLYTLMHDVSLANRSNNIRWKKELDYQSEYERISQYINEKNQFLDSIWTFKKRYCCIKWTYAEDEAQIIYTYFIPKGKTLGECNDEFANELVKNSLYEVNGDDFDITKSIDGDIQLIAKNEDINLGVSFLKDGDFKKLFLAGSTFVIIFLTMLLFGIDVSRNSRDE